MLNIVWNKSSPVGETVGRMCGSFDSGAKMGGTYVHVTKRTSSCTMSTSHSVFKGTLFIASKVSARSWWFVSSRLNGLVKGMSAAYLTERPPVGAKYSMS